MFHPTDVIARQASIAYPERRGIRRFPLLTIGSVREVKPTVTGQPSKRPGLECFDGCAPRPVASVPCRGASSRSQGAARGIV